MVLDTNVYVSLFTRPKSRIFQLWLQARRGKYTLLVSPVIMGEIGRTLRERFGWKDETLVPQLKLLARTAEVITPPFIPEAIEADPDDNHILACAIAGKADLIVSGDKHLRRLKTYQDIPIIRPTDFLHTLEGL